VALITKQTCNLCVFPATTAKLGMRLGEKRNENLQNLREKPHDRSAGRGGSTNPAGGREYLLANFRIFA